MLAAAFSPFFMERVLERFRRRLCTRLQRRRRNRSKTRSMENGLSSFSATPVSQLSSTMFIFFHSDRPPHLFRLFIYFFRIKQAPVPTFSQTLISVILLSSFFTPCTQLYSVTFAYLQNALLFCFVRTAVTKPYL